MRKWTPLSVFLPSLMFPLAAFAIGVRNPSVFDAPSLIRHAPLVVSIILISSTIIILRSGRSPVLKENFDGLILSLLFTAGYFMLGSMFNKADINTNNVFFAADNWSWYQRMADPDGWSVGTRAVHPLTYVLFRPLIAGLSLFTAGDRYHANLVLLAAVGGGCVFLTWKIVKRMIDNSECSILYATLLGLSASHLIFSSVIESYIFSTASLLLFFWLLIEKKPACLLVASGIVTFGITITNTLQQVITSLFFQRNLKRILFVFLAIALAAFGLSFISKIFYPLTEYFFLPQNLIAEQRFAQRIDLKRAALLLNNIFIYSMAAPQPYMGVRNGMPRFNLLNGSILNYIWFGVPALIGWIGLLFLALYRYFAGLSSEVENRFLPTSLFMCLILNFLIHIGYGIEPFLYSADWVYALVLFTAIVLKNLADQDWFKIILFLLVAALFVNNLWFLYLIVRQASAHLV